MEIELVVCRHGEDLSWVRNVPRNVKITVYDKTPPPTPLWSGGHPLPNRGREAHTWLHHLTERHDSLADWTVFAQGRPFDHAPDLHAAIRRWAAGETPLEDFVWLGFLWETDDAWGHPSFVHWTKNPERRQLDLEGFFQRLWGIPAPAQVRYVGGGQFCLSRKAAQRNPRDFYQRARDLALEFPDAAHAFERTWDRVFQAPLLDPAAFGPSGLRLLKPIKARGGGKPLNPRGNQSPREAVPARA